MFAIRNVSRRRFLQGGAAAGLVLATRLPLPREAAAQGGSFMPNAFVRIAPDNTVTVIAKHIEFGQGTYTGLATIVAEELDADWSQLRTESAPADHTRYNNLMFGQVQGTGGSSAIANSWDQLRKAGAAARAMLVEAAAREWGVPAGEITVDKGVVSHRRGKQAQFGALAMKAAQLQPPADPPLKDAKNFKLVGAERVPRVDTAAKSDGSAQFTIDVYLPDMLTAMIERPPRFGAQVASFDAGAAKQVPGVIEVVQVPAGVAVLARNTWAARKGREALRITWDESKAETRGSEELFREYRTLVERPGLSARKEGDAGAALELAARRFEAVYEFPYLAHAPMEPLDCVIRLGQGQCEVWAGSQLQTVDQGAIAKVLGLPPEKVQLTTMLAGGSFGRRATPNADVATEAATIVKTIGGRAPVKLIWTREDDIRGGRYRPLYVHRLRGGLDAAGNIIAWEHRIAGQSITKGTPFEPAMVKDGIDGTSVEGAATLPYAIPNLGVELHTTDVAVPVLWWRSVGSTHTAYSTETFLDQLAIAAGKDPVALRRLLLKDHPRHLAALELAASKAGWGAPLPQGKARGVAVHESFNTAVAQVVEISMADGALKVERVVCAVDCGTAVNPDVVRAQMEGGIGFGLGAALHDEVTLVKGAPVEANFDTYRPLRIEEMPAVEVHIVPSAAKPTGVGEPGVPPIAPAIANAMAQLTGQRVYRLPFLRAAV
jgi:isoquinoline 1-oxidoreductase beta subunit